jgi:hypothetical protein
MKYKEQEEVELINAISTMVISNPVIDNHIDKVLEGKDNKITAGMIKRLKELVSLYITGCVYNKRITDTFMAYCLGRYYNTFDMFSDDVKVSVDKFIKTGGIKYGNDRQVKG